MSVMAKTRAFLSVFLISLMITGFMIVSITRFGSAQSGTTVNGIINMDTTWSNANGPYTLTGNVLVNNGVTLTISAGVTVDLGSYLLSVNGTLQAIGNMVDPIILKNGQITFTQFSTNWTASTGTGCIIQNAIVTSALSLEDSTMINNNTITGGISVGNQFELGKGYPTISNNTITGQGIALNWEGNVTADILGNVISGCHGAGIVASVPGSGLYAVNAIEGNLIVNNTHGIEIWVNGVTSYDDILENNTITNNSIGIALYENWSPQPLLANILYNNIYGNIIYNINMNGSLGIPYDINAAYNWWGTTNSQDISQGIYDYYDNFNLGKVNFDPFLTAPSEAPTYIIASAGVGGLINPSGIVRLYYGGSQTFSITANTGYHVTEVYVNGTAIGAVNTYTVQNIQGATTFSATFSSNTPKTWLVDSQGTGDFNSIQAAINASASGDTIYVKSGTYDEHPLITKTLTLIGQNASSTIIDGQGQNRQLTSPDLIPESSGSILAIVANGVTVSGFTIQNSVSGGSAIWLQGYNYTTVSNNIIINDGDGIRILNSTGNMISGNTITNNPYTSLGFDSSYNNSVISNFISNNYIGIGAGIPSYNNTFSYNNVTGNSYGFYLAMYNSTFFRNNISNNVQVAFYGSYTNSWDNGVSGGNFWSDYRSKYPNASQIGNSGIGNTPYVIDSNNKDNYPLWTSQNGGSPPSPSDAKILSYSWYVAPATSTQAQYIGDLIVVGEVQNVGTNTLGSVIVAGSAYNSTGGLLASSETAVYDYYLFPGPKSSFLLRFHSDRYRDPKSKLGFFSY